MPTWRAGPMELEGRASAEHGHLTPLRLALWVPQGVRAWPAGSAGAEAVAQASRRPPWATPEPLGGRGQASQGPGQLPVPPPHSSLALCRAGTHRSTSGTACCAGSSAWPPARAPGAASGSESSLSPLVLMSPLVVPLSPLLELHRTLRGGRRPRLRRCRFCRGRATWRSQPPRAQRRGTAGRRARPLGRGLEEVRLQGAEGAGRAGWKPPPAALRREAELPLPSAAWKKRRHGRKPDAPILARQPLSPHRAWGDTSPRGLGPSADF